MLLPTRCADSDALTLVKVRLPMIGRVSEFVPELVVLGGGEERRTAIVVVGMECALIFVAPVSEQETRK